MIEEGDDDALSIIYNKYTILISKKIRDFHLTYEFDDILQECLIVLDKSIKHYNNGVIPFYTFFYKNLLNKLSSIKKTKSKNRNIIYDEKNIVLMDSATYNYPTLPDIDIFSGLSDLDKQLINFRYLKKWSVSRISKEFKININTIYYHLRNAKNIIKKNITSS